MVARCCSHGPGSHQSNGYCNYCECGRRAADALLAPNKTVDLERCARCRVQFVTRGTSQPAFHYPVGAAIVRLCERCWTDCYGRPPMAGPMALGGHEEML